MSALTRRERFPLVEAFDWLDWPLTAFRPVTGHPMRVEDYVRDGQYILKAELPGVDPAKDIDVTVSKGVLTIKSQRQEHAEGRHHSEFHYGAVARSFTLPAGADDEHVRAFYDNGVLEVVADLKENAEKGQHHIPVMIDKHIKPT